VELIFWHVFFQRFVSLLTMQLRFKFSLRYANFAKCYREKFHKLGSSFTG
jgi:hypothetical protein